MNDFKFRCPHCGQHLSSDERLTNQEIKCPACNQPFLLPPNRATISQREPEAEAGSGILAEPGREVLRLGSTCTSADQDNRSQSPPPIPRITAPTEAELRAFVGPNADYYLNKWSLAKVRPGQGGGYNWPAFLLGGVWLPYRKLYAAASTLWGIALLLGIWNLLSPKAGPAISFPGVFAFIPFLLLLALASYANQLYLAKARKVITQVRAQGQSGETHLATIAQRGGTSRIAALGFPAVFLFGLFGAALALNLAGLSPSPYGKRLLFNAGELYYKRPVTEQQARRLGEYLVGTHFFDGTRKTVQLTRPGDTLQFRVVVKGGLEPDQQKLGLFRQFGLELSRKVFDGAPLEIHLCDQRLNTLTTVTIGN